jgi:Tol biopolymer transport system component
LNGFHSRLASLYRPPSGDEIAFVGSGSEGDGLYLARRDGSGMRPLVTATIGGLPFVDLANPEWSPDGSRIAFMARAPGTPEWNTILYLINADGSSLRRLSPGCPGETSENFPAWSPDGARIALMRWCPVGDDPGVRPITVVDVATGVAREVGNVEANGYAGWSWSPDGTSIIEVPAPPVPDGYKLLVVNATTGTVTRTGQTTSSAPAWQRALAAH